MYAKLQQIGKRIQYMQLNYIKISPYFLILRLFHFPLFAGMQLKIERLSQNLMKKVSLINVDTKK